MHIILAFKTRKGSLVLAFSFCFVLSMSCQGSGPKVSASKSLVPDTPTASLGDIEAGRVYQCAFTVRNEGSAPVTITRIRPACGVVAELSSGQKTVHPGQSATIFAKLDARSMSGPFSRSVTVMTDAVENPEIRLFIEGTVVDQVNVVPSPIDLGFLSRKTEKRIEGVIELPASVSHRLDSVSLEDSHFSLALHGDSSGRTRAFELTFKGSSTPVRILTNMAIRLQGETEPREILVPVRVEVYGDLRYAHDVYLLRESDGTAMPREVPVTTRSGRTFQILKAEDPDHRVSVEIVEPFGSPAVLRLAAKSAFERKTEGHVLFETDVRGEEKKSIHYVIPASPRDY